jgi:hypothetical protein
VVERKKILWQYKGEKVVPCRSCGKDIFFVKTKKGKFLPVNRETLEAHFTDCPEAKEWRKKRDSAKKSTGNG